VVLSMTTVIAAGCGAAQAQGTLPGHTVAPGIAVTVDTAPLLPAPRRTEVRPFRPRARVPAVRAMRTPPHRSGMISAHGTIQSRPAIPGPSATSTRGCSSPAWITAARFRPTAGDFSSGAGSPHRILLVVSETLLIATITT
jgi:hypothetical protein